MPPDLPPMKPATLAWASLAFYVVMGLAGILIMGWADLDPQLLIFGPPAALAPDLPPAWLAGLIGLAAGLLIVGLTHLGRRLTPLARLNREFATALGPLPTSVITVLALTSGIGEELLFRGALLPLLGLLPSTLIFALLHGGGARHLWSWTLFAFLTGLLLAGLTLFTQSLLAPILAHVTVNYWNLHALVARPAP